MKDSIDIGPLAQPVPADIVKIAASLLPNLAERLLTEALTRAWTALKEAEEKESRDEDRIREIRKDIQYMEEARRSQGFKAPQAPQELDFSERPTVVAARGSGSFFNASTFPAPSDT